MSVKRLVRVNELLKREIAEALYRVMTEQAFDFSAVTVTGVETSSDLRAARVRISIRDHRDDRDAMLIQIKHHAKDIQRIIQKHVILKYTPKLHFHLDESIEQGDHVLQVIAEMEQKGISGMAPMRSDEEVSPDADEEDK